MYAGDSKLPASIHIIGGFLLHLSLLEPDWLDSVVASTSTGGATTDAGLLVTTGPPVALGLVALSC